MRIYDDTRWPFQKQPRVFCSEEGTLNTQPGKKINGKGNWLNIDNRMGYAVLGSRAFTMTNSLEYYHTWSLSFVSDEAADWPLQVPSGERVNCFAMVSCPGQRADDTATTAAALLKNGWRVREDGVLAIHVTPYLVFVNFTATPHAIEMDNRAMQLAAWSWACIPCEHTVSEIENAGGDNESHEEP